MNGESLKSSLFPHRLTVGGKGAFSQHDVIWICFIRFQLRTHLSSSVSKIMHRRTVTFFDLRGHLSRDSFKRCVADDVSGDTRACDKP
ncbi:hypothetical protein TNIN_282211 [Trichonephila inaurata madagascariensis]|uniref:Uncharacterized protein n=1 Tax=Trichonephila inaurata madagascariensis TaxID=2747483 RepID=A0A8X6MIW5_9ARAC|nr:hypothetical protein TNIN_282211 [Trichonephila inaurata madagascariensis]